MQCNFPLGAFGRVYGLCAGRVGCALFVILNVDTWLASTVHKSTVEAASTRCRLEMATPVACFSLTNTGHAHRQRQRVASWSRGSARRPGWGAGCGGYRGVVGGGKRTETRRGSDSEWQAGVVAMLGDRGGERGATATGAWSVAVNVRRRARGCGAAAARAAIGRT